MNYRSAVAEAKRLRKRSEEDSWRLAELTFEIVDAGASRKQWSRDTGIAASTVGVYFHVWRRWGHKALSDRPRFWDAYAKVSQADDAATQQSRKADGNIGQATPKAVRRHVQSERVPVADKAAMLDDLMGDPRVMREWREERARALPDVTPAQRKEARAAVTALFAPLVDGTNELVALEWEGWLLEIAETMAETELSAATVRKLDRALAKVVEELEVQKFRLGLEVRS